MYDLKVMIDRISMFDVLIHRGRNVLRLPLEERRELLADSLKVAYLGHSRPNRPSWSAQPRR
jgi:ATP-dependent DNA ligase